MHLGLLAVFGVAYLAVTFEGPLRVNKAAIMLLAAVACWGLFFAEGLHQPSFQLAELGNALSQTAQIVFFLMGAMTIVELVDSHHGFQILLEGIHTCSKVRLTWVVGLLTFFVSAVMDNLTTTIVMASVLRRLLSDKKDLWLFGSLVIIAANAGGAWTVIGDVTTTMLWIGGRLTSWSVMKELFLPSLAALLVVQAIFSWKYWGKRLEAVVERKKAQPGARLAFFLGLAVLISVPIFKKLTGLPPYMGILLAVGIMWVITDLMHHGEPDREHLKVPNVLSRIDIPTLLYFLGALMAVEALRAGLWLDAFANWLVATLPGPLSMALTLGIVSAIVDNVPLVAAAMAMFDINTFVPDSPFWNLLAYAVGTGGSMIIIGSAAGLTLMGLFKVPFWWYMRHVAPIALISYGAGAFVYLILGG